MEITIIIKGATSIEEVRKAFEATEKIEAAPINLEIGEEIHKVSAEPEPQEEAAPKWHYKRKRTCHKWLTTEEQYIKDLADKGVSASGIADALYTKFGFRVSPQAVKSRIIRLSA